MVLFVGDDWSEAHHDVEVGDAESRLSNVEGDNTYVRVKVLTNAGAWTGTSNSQSRRVVGKVAPLARTLYARTDAGGVVLACEAIMS
jgi:hypothetical protein